MCGIHQLEWGTMPWECYFCVGNAVRGGWGVGRVKTLAMIDQSTMQLTQVNLSKILFTKAGLTGSS